MSSNKFRECKTKEKVVDRFRALILAHSENAESTFSVLLSDLSSDLKESNTTVEEFLNVIAGTVEQARNKLGIPSRNGESQGSMPASGSASLNVSRSNSESSTSRLNGRQTRSGRLQGICSACGHSSHLVDGRCRDCISKQTPSTRPETSSANDQSSTPEQPPQRVHCSNCSKRLAPKREAFGTCLYCENKLNGRGETNNRSDRQSMKLEQVDLSDN